MQVSGAWRAAEVLSRVSEIEVRVRLQDSASPLDVASKLVRRRVRAGDESDADLQAGRLFALAHLSSVSLCASALERRARGAALSFVAPGYVWALGRERADAAAVTRALAMCASAGRAATPLLLVNADADRDDSAGGGAASHWALTRAALAACGGDIAARLDPLCTAVWCGVVCATCADARACPRSALLAAAVVERERHVAAARAVAQRRSAV